MFWVNKNFKSSYEPNTKFRFFADFVFTADEAYPLKGNVIENQLVKSITAPSLNIDFERAYANQHVHYFQNGSIHWEPIQIVLFDYSSKENQNILSNRLFEYLRKMGGPNNGISAENRTKLIDLPIFCRSIKINQIAGLDDNDGLSVQEVIKMNTLTAGEVAANQNQAKNNLLTYDNYSKNKVELSNLYFKIINPRINKIDFGSFDYGSEEINTITLTVIPEWCINTEDPEEQRNKTSAEQFKEAINISDDYRSSRNPSGQAFRGVSSIDTE